MSNHRATRLQHRAFQRQALPHGPTSQLAKAIHGDISADELLWRDRDRGARHIALRRTMVSKLETGESKVKGESIGGKIKERGGGGG